MSDENYFMVIPAAVWNDNRLSAASVLLYGRISLLTKKAGYCYARNHYLAEQLNTNPRSIQRRLLELAKAGHIKIEVETTLAQENGRFQAKRKIWLNVLPPPTTNLSPPHDKFVAPPHDKSGADIIFKEEEILSTEKSTPTPKVSEFLDILRADPYFEGIDIDAEYERAVQWCEKKNRALTQRFFRDWLGRADRPDLEEDDEPEYSEPEDWNEERLHALLQVYPPAKMPPAPWAHIPLDVRMAVDAQVKVNQANEKKAGDRNTGANGNGSNGSQSGASGIACGSPKDGAQTNVATDKTVSEKDIAS